jgi:FkbM family methyltransferase
MQKQILNLLRNQKEWLELHRVPFLSRSSDEKLFARYAMTDHAVADLWESDPDALYVEPLIGANAVVLDVGANLGTFCYTVQRTNQPICLVAFEPIPILAKRLRNLFKDCLVMEIALSDVKTMRTFRIPFIEGRRCNSRGSLAPIVDSDSYVEITLQSDLLDNVFPSTGLQSLDLVKIDVEGHELEVVRGGEHTLRRYHPMLLIEIEQRHHGGEPIASIWNFIEGLGYAGFFLNRGTLDFDGLERFSVAAHQRREDMGTHGYINNFLFIPRGAATETWRQRLSSHLRRLLGGHLSRTVR